MHSTIVASAVCRPIFVGTVGLVRLHHLVLRELDALPDRTKRRVERLLGTLLRLFQTTTEEVIVRDQ